MKSWVRVLVYITLGTGSSLWASRSDVDLEARVYGQNHHFKEACLIFQTNENLEIITAFSGTLSTLRPGEFPDCLSYDQYRDDTRFPRNYVVTCASCFHDYWKTTRHAPDQQVMLAPEHWYVSFEATLKTPLTRETLETVDKVSEIRLNPYYAKGKFEDTHDEAVSDYAVVVLGAPKDATYHPLPIFPLFYADYFEGLMGFFEKEDQTFYTRKGTHFEEVCASVDSWFCGVACPLPEKQKTKGHFLKKPPAVAPKRAFAKGAGLIMIDYDLYHNPRRRLVGVFNGYMHKNQRHNFDLATYEEAFQNPACFMMFRRLYNGTFSCASLDGLMS